MTEASKIVPTDEQIAVIESMASPESVMVEAKAGCAKSKTLELSAPRVRVPALGLAFNKRIAEELAPRMPGNFQIKTLNAMGHGAWARALGGKRLVLDERKLGKLVTETARNRNVDLASEQWDQIRQLVTKVMQAGITPMNRGRPLLPDTDENWASVAIDQLGMLQDDFEFVYDLAREVLDQSVALAFAGTISFDDQVYASVCLGGQFPKFPVVFVDEAQDLSPLNHAMLGQCLRPDGKLVAVGDPRQAIYAFRGADSESMRTLRGLRPGWSDFPLNTTFRCPKAIVARQQEHAPGFRAWHTNPEGAFRRLPANTRSEQGVELYNTEADPAWTWADVVEALPDPKAQVAILCRNNSPLLSIAFKLLRQGIGVTMLGRDIGKGLIVLSKKIAPKDDLGAEACAAAIDEWLGNESAAARLAGHEERIASLEDRAECLKAVLTSAGCRTAGDLRAMLKRLFERDTGTVVLGSIHRAKGLEWDCVLHLDPWRIPSKQARRAAQAGDTAPLQQEFNLLYVCETRTRHTLLQASLEEFH